MTNVDVPITPPLPPWDYLAAIRQVVCNPHEHNSGICIRSLTL